MRFITITDNPDYNLGNILISPEIRLKKDTTTMRKRLVESGKQKYMVTLEINMTNLGPNKLTYEEIPRSISSKDDNWYCFYVSGYNSFFAAFVKDLLVNIIKRGDKITVKECIAIFQEKKINSLTMFTLGPMNKINMNLSKTKGFHIAVRFDEKFPKIKKYYEFDELIKLLPEDESLINLIKLIN
jgi:hypothetical protein